MPTLAFFEDEAVAHLKPLIHTRPVYDLRAGILPLRHRIELDLGRHADFLLSRPEVRSLASLEGNGSPQTSLPDERADSTLFINGRLLTAGAHLVGEWRALLEGDGESPSWGRRWRSGETVVAAWCPSMQSIRLENGVPAFDDLEAIEVQQARLVNRLWDLVGDVARFIDDDASAMGVRGVSDDAIVSAEALLIGTHFMAVGPGAVIEPGAILISDEGPVIVERDAHIMAGAILRGPCHIGKGSRVKMGARVTSSSLGEQCRVGGEVSNSVLLGFSNKAHDGYVGNSYIAAWCNIGADTNTSNLRNDYGEVTLYNEHLRKYESSGSQFVGLIMGDHSRSGINTMFNTGTVVGLACNVFGAGYQPRHIPSFSWGGRDRLMDNNPEKVFASIRAMMERRGKVLSADEEAALAAVYESGHADIYPSGSSP
ncbi:MAG: putative sugar nucleotidyl transferase [Rhodothermales bacterium]